MALKVLHGKDALWRKVIVVKFGRTHNFWLEKGNLGSLKALGKPFTISKRILAKRTKISVGLDFFTSSWKGHWIGLAPFPDLFLKLVIN